MTEHLKPARFLSIGECMVEMAPQAGGLFAMGFAGDTLNTAWYARRALPPEWTVGYLTAVGTDRISDDMVGFIEDSGLDSSAIARVPERTVGLYLIQLSGAERSFAYWRDSSAARLLAADAGRLRAALDGARLAYLSGITLAILSPADRAVLLQELTRARAAGTLVAFDPNLRPRLWPDAPTMRDAVTRAAQVADIVLPSFDDEAAAFGDADPQATARRYAARGAGLVVAKNGAGEVAALSDGQMTLWTPPAVAQPVDTTAAGDSFNAAFLAAHLTGAGLLEALQAGAALAGKVIGQRGALVEL
ncbi:sugar kinase [Frigidibacter sp. SLM-1]|nr:sugar kinase [Frigidibacter sp. ROC022]MCR8723758.1 sugar kinase [Frigidibacter sp. ROC022]